MSETKENARQYSFLEIIGVIVSLSGFLAGLSWLHGRYYYNGFYEAYGVPDALANVAGDKITAVGALQLVPAVFHFFLYFVILLAASMNADLLYKGITNVANKFLKQINTAKKITLLYSIAIIALCVAVFISGIPRNELIGTLPFMRIDLTVFFIIMISELIGTRGRVEKSEVHQTERKNKTNLFGKTSYSSRVLLALFIFVTFWITLMKSWTSGYENGCQYVAAHSQVFSIYSTNALPLEGTLSQNQTFKYSGYYGVVKNDYLILYKEMDTKTGQPKEVYYINKDEILGFTTETSYPSQTQQNNTFTSCRSITDVMVANKFPNFLYK